MRPHFWIKLLLYILPFAAGFLLLTGALVYIGESMPLRWVVWHHLRDDSALFRYRYGNRDLDYKRLMVNARQPEVMALGSSRILQFRAAFLNTNPAAFYNAGAPAWGMKEMIQLLQSVNVQALPRVLILTVGQPWFHPEYQYEEIPENVSDFENLFLVNRAFLQDVLNGEPLGRDGFDVLDYFNRQEPAGGALALGMRAIRDGHGFRADGSEQYGDFLVAQWLGQEQQREHYLDMMRSGTDMFLFGATISEQAIDELRILLDYAHTHGIFVIGFLPPYMPSLWQEMMSLGNHTYQAELPARLEPVFAEYGYVLFDFSDGAVLGLTDDDFFDGWHISELGSLLMYIRMLEALPDVLGPYSNLESLWEIAIGTASTWDVFSIDGQPHLSQPAQP